MPSTNQISKIIIKETFIKSMATTKLVCLQMLQDHPFITIITTDTTTTAMLTEVIFKALASNNTDNPSQVTDTYYESVCDCN